MKHLKMCLNPKVLAGLAVVGVGIYVYAPGLFAAALPLLVLAVCPLSMVLMMKAMSGGMKGNASGCEQTSEDSAGARAMSDAELEAQLQGLQAQQTALADQLQARRRNEAPAS